MFSWMAVSKSCLKVSQRPRSLLCIDPNVSLIHLRVPLSQIWCTFFGERARGGVTIKRRLHAIFPASSQGWQSRSEISNVDEYKDPAPKRKREKKTRGEKNVFWLRAISEPVENVWTMLGERW